MTNKIISALEQNYEKFDTIERLQKTYMSKLEEKEDVLNELKKRCSILKDLNTRKVLIGNIKGWSYSFSPSGISKVYKNIPTIRELGFKNHNEDFDINEELYEISKIPRVKRYINKIEAKRKFDKFFKYNKLLKNEPRVKIEFKKEVELKNIIFANNYDISCTLNLKIKKVMMKIYNGRIQIIFLKENGIIADTLTISSISDSWKEKIYIEQMYNNIKVVIERELKNRIKETENLKLFIQMLKEELPEYFMLEVIENANA
jgi:hypothetical protein